MRVPSSGYEPRCPECGCKYRITLVDAAGYWLADQWWTCPRCGSEFTTAELHDEERKNKDAA